MTTGELGELRRQQASDLRTIMGHDSLVPASEEDVPSDLQRDNRFDNEYGRLAERLHAGFVFKANSESDERLRQLAERPNILNGTYVMTSILSYGPKAFIAHLQGRPVPEGAAEDLGEILRRSSEVPKLFADCDIKSNHTLEINFGLLQYGPLYEELPFIIDEGDEGLQFKPAPATLRNSRMDLVRRQLEGDVPQNGNGEMHCPAIGRVMTAFWNTGIDECVSNPNLFQAGLAEAFASATRP